MQRKTAMANRRRSTIHHLPFDEDRRNELVYDDDTLPTREFFNSVYEPAETILGITDPGKAYHHAQGNTVNATQNAVHMVRSASPGDIIEIVEPEGREFYFIDPIGFTELTLI